MYTKICRDPFAPVLGNMESEIDNRHANGCNGGDSNISNKMNTENNNDTMILNLFYSVIESRYSLCSQPNKNFKQR
jgi:hypothetical protein